MPSSIVQTQLTFSAAESLTISSASVIWSDAITLNAEDWDASLQVSADNQGTPATGDNVEVYVAFSNGDLLGDGGNDFDTFEYSTFLGSLNTYSADSPGEDPARRTFEIKASGKVAVRFGFYAGQAATRNIAVRGRFVTHRPQ